jgi:antitoxin MazE
MKTVIRKMGNSQGVLIPKPLLAQVGLEDEAEMRVEGRALVLRKPRSEVRRGWTQASQALAETGQDKLVWPDFSNQDDVKLKW